MLPGMYISLQVYRYANKCMYMLAGEFFMLAGVCIRWQVYVYDGRCVYMLAGVCMC